MDVEREFADRKRVITERLGEPVGDVNLGMGRGGMAAWWRDGEKGVVLTGDSYLREAPGTGSIGEESMLYEGVYPWETTEAAAHHRMRPRGIARQDIAP